MLLQDLPICLAIYRGRTGLRVTFVVTFRRRDYNGLGVGYGSWLRNPTLVVTCIILVLTKHERVVRWRFVGDIFIFLSSRLGVRGPLKRFPEENIFVAIMWLN